jgi:hypothetical protein
MKITVDRVEKNLEGRIEQEEKCKSAWPNAVSIYDITFNSRTNPQQQIQIYHQQRGNTDYPNMNREHSLWLSHLSMPYALI